MFWKVYREFHSNSAFVCCDKISGLEDELERRTLTYTSWNQTTILRKRRSWHPITFDYADASPWKMREIKVSSSYVPHKKQSL